jgi:hypothetical protein
MIVPLKLYISNPKRTGKEQEKVFSTETTEITASNQNDFFRFDHTIILFQDGYAAQRNFVHCSALVIDIDNKGVDDPFDWTTVDSISERLAEMGIAHTIVTSRNHEKEKGKESPRPRFHVYLPLATPCNFAEYKAMCEWLITNFHSDPAVKSPAQFIYGNADNPNNIVLQVDGKQCFDQFFQSIPFQVETQKQRCTPPHPSMPLTGVHPADAFNENGREVIKQFLQKHGWKYMRQDSVNEYWQRPGKDHPKQHSATIKLDAPLFHVFSSNCHPLKDWKAYNFFQLYAILEHHGDFAAATKDLAGQGYGDALTTQPVELPEFITELPRDEDESEESDDDCSEHFPAHLLNVPGFVSDFAQYVNSVSHVDQPTYSLATALAFQALLCAQNVKDPTGIRTNPYIIVAGLSASGKDKGREIIKKIFTQIQNDAKNGFHETLDLITERVASYQALENWLHANKGIGLWLWDEIGKELPTFFNDRSPFLSGIPDTLMRLYTSANSTYFPPKRADKKNNLLPIQQPNLVLYGTAEKETLYNAFTVASLTDGLLGRIMIFEGKDDAKRIKQTVQAPIHERITEDVRWWLEKRDSVASTIIPQPKVVPITLEAEKVFDELEEYRNKIHKEKNRVKDALWGRVVEQARQFALIYACSADKENPMIDENAAGWAAELANYLIKRKIYIADRYVADSEFDRQQKEIVRYIESCGGKCEQSMLTRKFQRLEKRRRDDIITNLKDTGVIREERQQKEGSQKYALFYILTKRKKSKS